MTDAEFLHVYEEWMSQSESHSNKKTNYDVNQLRLHLFENKYGEKDLFAILELCIWASGRKLLDQPIAYRRSNDGGAASLCICSSAWLKLVRDLFQMLDTEATGIWTFDQVFFYQICLVIGKGFADSKDSLSSSVRDKLDTEILVADTLNLMERMGASVSFSYKASGFPSINNTSYNINDNKKVKGSRTQRFAGGYNGDDHIMNFKRLFL